MEPLSKHLIIYLMVAVMKRYGMLIVHPKQEGSLLYASALCFAWHLLYLNLVLAMSSMLVALFKRRQKISVMPILKLTL